MADKIVIGILRALFTAETAQATQDIKRLQAQLGAFSKESNRYATNLKNIGSSLTMMFSLPIATFGASVVKFAGDFESSFAGVEKTTAAVGPELEGLSLGLRDLAKQIPIDVNELNKLAETAGALGIPTKSIVEFTRVMALLGTTTNVTAEQAANDIAKIQNIFEAVGEDTERFASALLLLGREGASTEAQILELSNRMASAGRAVGFSQDQILAWAAAIANVGIEAEAGGSAFSRTVTDIALAVAKGTKDLQAFAGISGKSVQEFTELFRKDGPAAVQLFIESLSKVADGGGDLIKVLNQAGFIEVRQLNLLRALALAYAGPQGLNQMLRTGAQGWNENSEAARVAEIRYATLWAQLTMLWSRVKDIGITLGNALLPMIKSAIAVINEFMPAIEGMADAFGKLPGSVQFGIVAFAGIGALIPPLIYGLGQLAFAASNIAAAFGPMGVATKALTLSMTAASFATSALTTAMVTLGRASVALVATPLGQALLVLGLVTAGMLILMNQTEDLSDEMLETSFNIKKVEAAASPATEELKKQADTVTEASMAFEHYGFNLDEIAAKQKKLKDDAKEQAENIKELGSAAERHARAMQMFKPRDLPKLDLSQAERELNLSLGRLKGLNLSFTSSNKQILEAARKEIAAFSKVQRDEITAGRELGQSNKEIAESLAALGPQYAASEAAIGLYKDQLQAASTAARKAARDFAELTGVQERQEAAQLASLLETGQLRLAAMTTASQQEVNKVLREGVEAWIALGQAVPASVMRQLEAVSQLPAIQNQIKETIREGTEGLKAQQRDLLDKSSVSVEAQRQRAEATADVQLKAINETTAATREAGETAREIEFTRMQHTIDMAEQAGAHWQDVYAMERALHRRRVDAAIVDEQRQFSESVKLLNRSNPIFDKEYKAREAVHNATVQQMEEQFLLSEQKKWDALRRTKDVWFVALTNIRETAKTFAFDVTNNLGSIFFNLGHDIDGELRRAADEAKEHYEKVKRAGKSSAEAISNAFQRYREAEDRANHTFLERMREVWLSFKSMVIQILNDILGHFVRSFIAGMIRSISSAKLGQSVANMMMGGAGGGVGGVANLAGGAANLATGAGATAAGIAGGAFTTVNAAGMAVTPGLSSAFAPTAAGAGGGGALGFLSNPGFWTNPWTIGGIAAAALLTWGITKKGWFRGGEEGVQVNPRRDKFILQWAKPGDDVKSAGHRLATVLTQLTGEHGGGRMYKALQQADTVKEFESAQAAIVQFFRKQKINVRTFHTGGMVTANDQEQSANGWPWYRPLASGERMIVAQAGEGIINKAATTAIGGKKTIDAINRGMVQHDEIRHVVDRQTSDRRVTDRTTDRTSSKTVDRQTTSLRDVTIAPVLPDVMAPDVTVETGGLGAASRIGERAPATPTAQTQKTSTAKILIMPPPVLPTSDEPRMTTGLGATPTATGGPSATRASALTSARINTLNTVRGEVSPAKVLSFATLSLARRRGLDPSTPITDMDDPMTTPTAAKSATKATATPKFDTPNIDVTLLPKYHDGGVVDESVNREKPPIGPLLPSERVIVAMEGESVLNQEATASLGGKPAIDDLNRGQSPLAVLHRYLSATGSVATPIFGGSRDRMRANQSRTAMGLGMATMPMMGAMGSLAGFLTGGRKRAEAPRPATADEMALLGIDPEATLKVPPVHAAIWQRLMSSARGTASGAGGLMRSVMPRMFNQGGFVEPGQVVPAVLHGGVYGEDITPRQPGETDERPTRHITINHNVTVEGMISNENFEHFYRDFVIPAEKRALQLNTDDLLTVHRRTANR